MTSLLRNLLRLIDMIPIGYGVGLVVMFFTGTRRVGDLVAGTVVISERGRGTHIVTLLREAGILLTLEEGRGRRPGIYAFRELLNVAEGVEVF